MMDKQQYLKEIAHHWGSSSPIDPGWVVLGVGVVMLLVGGLSIARWWRTRHDHPTPMLTFFALGRRLRLGAFDQLFLLRISRQQKLPSPITLMLSPATLNAYGEAYLATRGPAQRDKLQSRLSRINSVLFEGGVSR